MFLLKFDVLFVDTAKFYDGLLKTFRERQPSSEPCSLSPQLQVFTINGRGRNHFPVASLWVIKLPWHHVQGIEDTLSHSSRDREVLLYFSDELAEVQKVTHYSKLHRLGLNPGLSSIKSFPGSGKKASSEYFVYWEYVLVSTFEPAGSEHAVMLSF